MRMRQCIRSRRGSQMVEFALIAPIMLFLVLALPAFGILIRDWIVVSAAARDGARQASFYSVPDSERRQVAMRTAANSVFLPAGPDGDWFKSDRDVTATIADGKVVVTVAYHRPSMLPFVGKILDPTFREEDGLINLKATAVFVVEKR